MNSLVEKQTKFPFAERFYKVERRYSFSKRPSSRQLTFPYRVYYPGVDFPRGHGPFFCELLSKRSSVNLEKSGFPLTELPDIILLKIFGYLHPKDRIHCLSTVCHKWSILARTPSLFKEVRVLLGGKAFHSGAAKAFLEKVSRHAVKLSLEACDQVWSPHSMLTAKQLISILPECMPSVKVLDTNHIYDLSAKLFEKMASCFPNVETLKLADLRTDSSFSSTKTNCFPHLKHLNITVLDVAQGFFSKVVVDNAQLLETLRIDNWFSMEFSNFLPQTLTELRVASLGEDSVEAVCKELRNLRVLSFPVFFSISRLRSLKSLHKLEHLHAQVNLGFHSTDSHEESNVHWTSVLPNTIKHLKLDCGEITAGLAEAIIVSCPHLETLAIDGANLPAGSFPLLASNLSSLRFLDVSRCGFGYFETFQEMTTEGGDRLLPQLCYLQCVGTGVDKSILRKICIRRKHLMVLPEVYKFLSFTVKEGGVEFDEEFSGDWDSIIDYLENQEEGFCCMSVP